jgi:hypothetical protein
MNHTRPHLLCIATVVLAGASIAPALGQATCPPGLAGLMPKGAHIRGGQYNSAGAPGDRVGIGFATTDLPFHHPCDRTASFPARITIQIKRYEGKASRIFRSQIDSVEGQLIQNDRQEFEAGPGGPFVLETAAQGTLLYHDWYSACLGGGAFPTVRLLAVAHTGDTSITVRIVDIMSKEAAKAAAMEVLTKFSVADFSLLNQGN